MFNDVTTKFHFQQVTLSSSKEHITGKHGLFERETALYTVTSYAFDQSLIMHPHFRLWLITTPTSGTPLPAVIIRYSMKIAWDDKLSHDATCRQSFLTLWNKHKHSNINLKELESLDVKVKIVMKYVSFYNRLFFLQYFKNWFKTS